MDKYNIESKQIYEGGEMKFKNDYNYNVNLNCSPYQNIYKNINTIFNGNYLEFIRSFSDKSNKDIKEFYTLCRKYQYSLVQLAYPLLSRSSSTKKGFFL